jgi:hypothetical protein
MSVVRDESSSRWASVQGGVGVAEKAQEMRGDIVWTRRRIDGQATAAMA